MTTNSPTPRRLGAENHNEGEGDFLRIQAARRTTAVPIRTGPEGDQGVIYPRFRSAICRPRNARHA